MTVKCSAGQSGYNMAPIKEVLLTARSRFHDLLIPADVQLASKAIAEDDLQQVRSEMAMRNTELNWGK